MKTNRYILSLLLLVVSVFNLTPANAQQNQYAIYNYRNDGDFNAWLNIDVERITYSCIDTLGVEHDDVVVQEVWTPDSVYRIPINAIDSIGFHAPKTVIKSDVFIIREIHVPYTLDVDSLSLLFDSSIPASMLPSIGQVVVSETFDGVYEEGFVGKVIKINNLGSTIEIICEDATLFDIYDQLIAVGKFESVEESSHSSKKLLPKRILGFDDVDKSGEYTFEIGKLKLQHNKFPWVSAEYTPELKFEYVLYIHKDDPIHVKFLISGKHDVDLNVDYKVSEKLSTESKDEIWIADVPLPYFYGFKPIFKIGLFYKVGGKAHVTGKIPVTISHGLGFEYHGSGFDISNVNILKSFDMNFGEPTLDLKIDGYMAGGLCADLGVKFLHKKLASIEGILKMGPKLTTSFDLSANDIVNDPSAYSILKNTKLKADFDIGIDAKYRILKKQARILPGKGWPGVKNVNQYEKEEDWPKGEISWSWNLFECYILPEFTHSFSSYNNQQAVFSTTASRELFIPVKIGAEIEKDGITETIMQPNSYWSEDFDTRTRTFDTQFGDIALGNIYTSRPVVEILGCRLTASPAAIVNTDIKQLSLKEGTKDTITIGNGNITFVVKSDNPKVVKCSIDKKDKSKMIIDAVKQGVATIVLTDTRNNESSMIQVTVVDKNTVELRLSLTELKMTSNSNESVTIVSGSGNYTVESSNSEVATAECTNNTILVTAHTVGTATITVTDTESGFTATINVTVTEEATDDLALSETTVSMKPNETAEVAITSGSGSYTVANSNADVAVAAISNGNKVVIAALKAGTATITVTDTKTKQTATIAVTVTNGTDVSPGEAIDLGLPSGTLWASCNVGATKPEEYGDYFAWGETEPKDDYSWGTYKWCNSSQYSLTKYCTDSREGNNGFTDNKTELDLEDDAAYVNWGSNWRMPSRAQQDELRSQCTWTWTQLNGVNGYRVTSKTNGNSIFLPTAGWRRGTSRRGAGSHGYYWSRSLHTSGTSPAYYLGFTSVYVNWFYADRFYGQSVRPVISPLQLSDSILNIKMGFTSSIRILSGTGIYFVKSSDNSIATAVLSTTEMSISNSIVITALSEGTTTILVTDIGSGQTSTISIVVTNPSFVDLGLPSGTLWAKHNIGAVSAEETGYFFAWGETTKKENYSWETYKWCKGSSSSITKYTEGDGKTELDLDDDAAFVNWGEECRMPSKEQFEELKNHCIWEWTTFNGINGNKITGPNGKSIFLPIAIHETVSNPVDFLGFYWSSSLNVDNPKYAIDLSFYYDNFNSGIFFVNPGDGNRPYGRSVRPVRR